MDEIANNSVSNLENKYIPKASPMTFAPTETFRTIYPLLNIWGKEGESDNAKDKAKYIYERLSNGTNEHPHGQLISILTKLGACHFGESKLDKVYKYFRLNNEAVKMIKHYENLVASKSNYEEAGKVGKYVKVLISEIKSAVNK